MAFSAMPAVVFVVAGRSGLLAVEDEAAQAGERGHARDGEPLHAGERLPREGVQSLVEQQDGVRSGAGRLVLRLLGGRMVGVEGVHGLDHHRVKVDLVVGVPLAVELQDVDDKVQEVHQLVDKVAVRPRRIAQADEQLQHVGVERRLGALRGLALLASDLPPRREVLVQGGQKVLLEPRQ